MPWQTVYWYFKKWTAEGIRQAVNDQVVMVRRMQKGGSPAPSFAVVDSQGHLLSVRVVSAALHDGTAALRWWQQELKKAPLLARVERLYGDKHFGGRFKQGVEKAEGVAVITIHEQIGMTKDGMKLRKKRWVVERTFAWELSSRRLTRDFERKPEQAEAFVYISSIGRLLRHLN